MGVWQAVIRLSKEYLPGMAVGFKHPKVTVHVGDGFAFLDKYKNTFDVIITDSSDPEGPAESLFQKPYFQLLFDALRPGGVITTQGCMNPFGVLVFYEIQKARRKRRKRWRGDEERPPPRHSACLRSEAHELQSPATCLAYLVVCSVSGTACFFCVFLPAGRV